MNRILFCDNACRQLYYVEVKHNLNKVLDRFAVLASQQKRCGYCGEQINVIKRIKEI